MSEKIPGNLKYTKEHEWVRLEGDVAVVGITHHAQEQLGDVVFVDLPEVGASLTFGRTFGTVESVKAVSDLFAPLSGEVVEINGTVKDKPELLNKEPYGNAWLLKVKVKDKAEVGQLLAAGDYEKLTQS